MFTESRVRALSALGAVVSLLIGIGTIGGAIASSFSEAVPLVLQILGAAGCVAVAVFLVSGAVMCLKERAWGNAAFFCWLAAAALFIAAWSLDVLLRDLESDREQALQGAGLITVVCVGWATVIWFRTTVREYRASIRECPDCAETIKAAAKVCRYCGCRVDAAAPSAPAADR